MFTVFAAKSPFINGVPEPDAIYNLLLSSVAVEGPEPNPIVMLFEELPEKKHPAFCPNAILWDPDVLLYKAQFPIAVLLVPVVLARKAARPIAVLYNPDVLLYKARFPIAVLLVPVVLENKARYPIAALYSPSVLEYKARYPIAVLFIPVVLEYKARYPIAVLFIPVVF
jgi:hypothetical protein